jgi:hypothetical protein
LLDVKSPEPCCGGGVSFVRVRFVSHVERCPTLSNSSFKTMVARHSSSKTSSWTEIEYSTCRARTPGSKKKDKVAFLSHGIRIVADWWCHRFLEFEIRNNP